LCTSKSDWFGGASPLFGLYTASGYVAFLESALKLAHIEISEPVLPPCGSVCLSNDSDVCCDVDLYVNVGGEADWRISMRQNKATGEVNVGEPHFSAHPAEGYRKQPISSVPPEVRAEFLKLRPKAIKLLGGIACTVEA
jgi:hypothetical protein